MDRGEFGAFPDICRALEKSGPFCVLLSGGIANKNGKTIASAIEERMIASCPNIDGNFIVMDITSADTAGQAYWCANIFKWFRRNCQRKAKLFVISNFWHLPRIWIMFAYRGVSIRPIASKTSGDWKFRLKRFLNEIPLIIITLFDPRYRLWFFERERQRRKKKARERDLSEM